MKKRLLALVTTLMLMVSVSTAVYASDGFNKAVFDNAPDVFVTKDDMTGDLMAASESLLGSKGIVIPETGGGYVQFYSGVSISDDMNLNALIFKYYADDWAFIDSIIIKIGNKRYKFDNINMSRDVLRDATIEEDAGLGISSSTLPMMADLIAHRDEEIRVRLQGDLRDIDFVLTDDVKNGIINIYNLYVAGGGTSKASMKKVDLGSKTTVTVGQD